MELIQYIFAALVILALIRLAWRDAKVVPPLQAGMFVVYDDPNGIVSAPAGAIAFRSLDQHAAWVNVDGKTGWKLLVPRPKSWMRSL